MAGGKFHSATALAPAAHIGFFMFPGRAACLFYCSPQLSVMCHNAKQKHLLIFKKEWTNCNEGS